jgi:DNA-binding transcriptional LysR family regulator
MDPRHLVQLAAILEHGSMTRASQSLHLTQPTLTHNMQTLEMQAGGKLFDRSRLGVRSTPLGELLARQGRAIARGLKQAGEASAKHRLGMRHQVRIGVGPLIGAGLMPEVAAVLLVQHPELAITLYSDRPHLLVDQLIDDQHDLVIAPTWLERPPPGIERELLIDDVLGVFCGPSHPLAAQRRLRVGEATSLRWLNLGIDSPWVRDTLAMLADVGVEGARTEVTVLGEAMIVLRLLSEGQHLAVLPRHPVRLLSRWFPVVELALDVEPKPRPLFLWFKSSTEPDQALDAVRTTIHACAAQALPVEAPAPRAASRPRARPRR